MQYLNLGLARISIEDLIKKSRLISQKMTNNPHFSDVIPRLDKIESLSQSLDKFNSLVDNGQTDKFLQLQKSFIELKQNVFLLGKYVALKSNGSSVIAASSGFELSKEDQANQEFVISL